VRAWLQKSRTLPGRDQQGRNILQVVKASGQLETRY
jgi:hypothetical protein